MMTHHKRNAFSITRILMQLTPNVAIIEAALWFRNNTRTETDHCAFNIGPFLGTNCIVRCTYYTISSSSISSECHVVSRLLPSLPMPTGILIFATIHHTSVELLMSHNKACIDFWIQKKSFCNFFVRQLFMAWNRNFFSNFFEKFYSNRFKKCNEILIIS